MLRRRVIPCLDVSAGRVVKGVNFVNLRDCGEPVAAAVRYARQGADEICWLNITAGDEAWDALLAQVEQAAEQVDVPVTVGGGVDGRAAGARAARGGRRQGLHQHGGAAATRGSSTSAPGGTAASASSSPSTPRPRAPRWRAYESGGRRPSPRDAVAWAAEAVERGAGELLVTSMDTDGTGQGYALDLLGEILARVTVPVIASGGAAGPEHLADALEAGCSAALAASIFHDGTHTVEEVKDACRKRGLPIR